MIEPSAKVLAEASTVEPWFRAALDAVARRKPDDILSHFHSIGDTVVLDKTRTRCRVHWLVQDAHGRPMVRRLAERLAREIVDYCIPRREILEALADANATGATDELLRLRDEARHYFSALETSGEGGELLLFFLLEAGLGIPQILCKMPHKTNKEMMINGVDGVHAKFTDTGNLAVYWGESKIYANFATAATDCLASIAPFLLDDGGGRLRTDMLLVRNNLDVGEQEIALELTKYFTDDEPERRNLEFRGACIIGFGNESSASAIFEDDGATPLQEVMEAVGRWHDGIAQRILNRKVERIDIEFFCLPLPSAESFRSEMKAALGI